MLEQSAKKQDQMYEEDGPLSDVAHAQNLMREAFPQTAHGNAKGSVWAAYRKLKLSTERRARAIWNGEARRIDAHEMRALEDAAIEQAQRDYITAKNKIEAYRQRIAETHTHFHGSQAD